MSVDLEALGLEELHVVRDRATGLQAVIAIHDRTLGPGRGGTRLRAYASLGAAAEEAARLARAMTSKFAIHRLPFGGGKAVLVDDGARGEALDARLRAYARYLERFTLEQFMTGPDYGIGVRELAIMREHTGRVVDAHDDTAAGQATALGVRVALEEGLRACGLELAGARVGVQGAGAVGGALVRELVDAGAKVTVCDVDPRRLEGLPEGVAVCPPELLLGLELEALAPCALPDALNPATVGALRCRVVAGAANDQLLAPELETARAVAARGVLYVPDVVANGGAAVRLTTSRDVAEELRSSVRAVLEAATAGGVTPYEAVQRLVGEALEAAR